MSQLITMPTYKKKIKSWKCELRNRMSCVRCPYCAKLLPPFFSALNRISKSPSSIMLSKPISSASSSALLTTNTLTSITVDGRGSCYVSEAITRPSLFRMTTPRLALLSSTNVVASNLILYQGVSRAKGDQDVCCWQYSGV